MIPVERVEPVDDGVPVLLACVRPRVRREPRLRPVEVQRRCDRRASSAARSPSTVEAASSLSLSNAEQPATDARPVPATVCDRTTGRPSRSVIGPSSLRCVVGQRDPSLSPNPMIPYTISANRGGKPFWQSPNVPRQYRSNPAVSRESVREGRMVCVEGLRPKRDALVRTVGQQRRFLVSEVVMIREDEHRVRRGCTPTMGSPSSCNWTTVPRRATSSSVPSNPRRVSDTPGEVSTGMWPMLLRALRVPSVSVPLWTVHPGSAGGGRSPQRDRTGRRTACDPRVAGRDIRERIARCTPTGTSSRPAAPASRRARTPASSGRRDR